MLHIPLDLPLALAAGVFTIASPCVRAVARHAGRLQQVFGVLVLATALAAVSAMAGPLKYPVAAPAFAGIEKWLSTDPLTVQQLRGKVVLIDFWTYTCINCINVMPHVKAWHDKYKDKGLVVVGVHTPEFSFEPALYLIDRKGPC